MLSRTFCIIIADLWSYSGLYLKDIKLFQNIYSYPQLPSDVEIA